MSTALVAPGRAMLVAPRQSALWRAFDGSSAASTGTGFSGPSPSSISGLSGWWDAGAFAGMVDGTGNPLPGWNNPASAVADQSGNGNPLAVYSYAQNGVAPQATPRLNGLLGGLGRTLLLPPAMPPTGTLLPQMDPDRGLELATASLGSATSWTIYLVWSRPNFAQGVGTAQISLLRIGGITMLAADALAGGNQRLILFPGASQIVLTNALERRHTHSVIIRNTPGAGVDVWLDAARVATAIPNPSSATLQGPLFFLHSGGTAGGAQCWFHEAALWSRSLASSDITTLLAAALRWTRGARKGVQLVVMGQSTNRARKYVTVGQAA